MCFWRSSDACIFLSFLSWVYSRLVKKNGGQEKRSKNKVFCETGPKVGAPWFCNAKQHNFELSWSSNTWGDETCVLSSLVTLANSRAAHSTHRLAPQQQPAGGSRQRLLVPATSRQRQPLLSNVRPKCHVQSWRKKPQMAQCHAECQTLRHASEPFPPWPTFFETLFAFAFVENAFKYTFQ